MRRYAEAPPQHAFNILLFSNRTRLRTRVGTAKGGNETIDQKCSKSSYATRNRIGLPRSHFTRWTILKNCRTRTGTRHSFRQIALVSACSDGDDLAAGICLTFPVVSLSYRGSVSPACIFTSCRTFYSRVSRETWVNLIKSFWRLTLNVRDTCAANYNSKIKLLTYLILDNIKIKVYIILSNLCMFVWSTNYIFNDV